MGARTSNEVSAMFAHAFAKEGVFDIFIIGVTFGAADRDDVWRAGVAILAPLSFETAPDRLRRDEIVGRPVHDTDAALAPQLRVGDDVDDRPSA